MNDEWVQLLLSRQAAYFPKEAKFYRWIPAEDPPDTMIEVFRETNVSILPDSPASFQVIFPHMSSNHQ